MLSRYVMGKKITITIWLLALLFPSVAWAEKKQYRNNVYTEQVKTLQVYLNDNQLDYPVMRAGTNDYVIFSFDWMSGDYPHLAYKIELCNADWTPTDLSEMEYLEGINEVVFEDPLLSMNTTFDYAHFSTRIPNEDLRPTLPGNYVVKVYDTDAPEKILMTGCFSIEENLLGITGKVSGHSVYGVNNEYQHLTFELLYGPNFSALPDELIVVVRQNGRHDNEVFGLKPTYVSPNSLIFADERKLSFEGGTEFGVLDFSHRYRFSGNIDHIRYHQPYYHVDVRPGKKEIGKGYAYDKDVNGHFRVHGQDVWSGAEIDYSIVHFTYPLEDPWLDGSLYVMGGFNDSWLDSKNKMVYNFERHQYEVSLLLKNGGYNYQYIFVPSGLSEGTIIRTEGSHWETENSYQIYVYYRPLGAAFDYDKLIGFFEINSQP